MNLSDYLKKHPGAVYVPGFHCAGVYPHKESPIDLYQLDDYSVSGYSGTYYLMIPKDQKSDK